jgi:hypothetical protein
MLGHGGRRARARALAIRDKDQALSSDVRPAPARRPARSWSSGDAQRPSIANAAAGIDLQLAALAALARLGDSRARRVRPFAAVNADHRFRAISDLGPRTPSDATAAPELIKRARRPAGRSSWRPVLGLGRHPAPGRFRSLFALAADPTRPTEIRDARPSSDWSRVARSAAVRDAVTPALVELLDFR